MKVIINRYRKTIIKKCREISDWIRNKYRNIADWVHEIRKTPASEILDWFYTIIIAIIFLGVEYVLYGGRFVHHFLNWPSWVIVLTSIGVLLVAFGIWFVGMVILGMNYYAKLHEGIL